MRASSISRPNRGGFTLVEILIVVVILGILAAIVIPALASPSRDARNATFCANLKTFMQLYMLYDAKHNAWPEDRQPAQAPPEMAAELEGSAWERTTPIGGQWDWDYLQFNCTAGVSVYQPDRTDAEMTEIDAMLDDGDLETGRFMKRANGYIYIIEP